MLTYIAIWLGVGGNEGEKWNDTNRLTFAITEQGASLQIYSLNTGESQGQTLCLHPSCSNPLLVKDPITIQVGGS